MLLDQGHSLPIDEAKLRIRDGSLFDWLEELYRGDPYFLDLSLYDAGERRTILKVFESMADNIEEDRKLGVVHNGLALCLAYCIEVMQSPDTFDDYRFDE
jgi:hypothetical protein